MASVKQRENGQWRARYRDESGKEHARHFKLKRDAQQWLAEQTAAVAAGTHLDPSRARTTVRDWCETWLTGYEKHRASTVRQARTHVRIIVDDLGSKQLRAVRPSDVRAWVVGLRERGYADSYVYALHSRLAQVYADAIHDGLVAKSPCSRRTAPPTGKQRPYVATTEQVWALHDAMPAHFRPVILLGAFVGLRVAEIAALRVEDVDFMRGVVTPAVQYGGEPLKTEGSRNPIPIPTDLAVMLNANPVAWGSETVVVGAYGRSVSPYTVETAFKTARETVEGLPEGFRIHDLRHYFASLLIAAGLDIKTVQARLRHASAKTTLDTYGHMWPDRDESSRAAVSEVLQARTSPPQQDAGTGS